MTHTRNRPDDYDPQEAKIVAQDMVGLRARVEKAEAVVCSIARLMCGEDTFPGDLVQYVKNEIDGRQQAERERDDLQNALTPLLEIEDTAAREAARADKAEARIAELEADLVSERRDHLSDHNARSEAERKLDEARSRADKLQQKLDDDYIDAHPIGRPGVRKGE